MLLRFRVLPLVFVISLLSGCGLASKAFYSAGDKLFQPGDDAVASMQTYSVAQFLQPFTLNPAKASRIKRINVLPLILARITAQT